MLVAFCGETYDFELPALKEMSSFDSAAMYHKDRRSMCPCLDSYVSTRGVQTDMSDSVCYVKPYPVSLITFGVWKYSVNIYSLELHAREAIYANLTTTLAGQSECAKRLDVCAGYRILWKQYHFVNIEHCAYACEND